MENGYSLSDLSAITNANGLGGNSAWVLILFFLIFGGNGWNRNANTDATTNEILSGQKFDSLSKSINAVGDGLASSTFALNNSINGVQTVLGGAITSEGRALQQQISDCCCSNKEAIAQVRYDMANFNAATAAAIHAEGETTRGLIQQNKIEALQAQLNNVQNQLNLQQAMGNVPKINPYMYGIVPTCGCNCNQ